MYMHHDYGPEMKMAATKAAVHRIWTGIYSFCPTPAFSSQFTPTPFFLCQRSFIMPSPSKSPQALAILSVRLSCHPSQVKKLNGICTNRMRFAFRPATARPSHNIVNNA
jgi:hypothetical protein